MVRCRNQPDLYHQHYDLLQRKYITKDPIGLKGGLNPYQYPLNPITNTDPLGLINFGTGMNSTGLASESAIRYLEPEAARTTIDNIVSTNGAWTPGHEYVMGWAIAAPAIPAIVMFAPAESIGTALTGAGLSCGSNTAYQLYKGDKFNYKDAALAALTGYLAPGRNILENTLISMGVTFLSKDGKPGATGGSGFGTAVSEVMSLLTPSYIPDAIVDFGGGVVSEYIGDKSEEIFDTEEEKK
ncbi:RHS repeat-associated core domain-containing protein [Salmonella enterica subsp. enterica serovar Liverpool]|nr:RHS repeat-associated core domain-containing protein [Salmonella enterica]MDO1173009.1 RHS repeat-associated core domain-containing protein [Salmonella enterica subsp. enterica serovar Liverpool]